MNFCDTLTQASQFLESNPIVLQSSLCLLWLVCAFVSSRLLRRVFQRLGQSKRLPSQVCGLLGKICITSSWLIFLTMALSAVGVNVVSILGAAGVLGVALGFASQTSLSNIICGIFIITERSIKIGDFISVDGCEGTVENINLLAVELRKIDNSLIRIPNQSLIQNPMTNITGSETRRCDFELGLDYNSDLDFVRTELLQLIDKQELFLKEPAPSVLFLSFAESTLNIRVGAWCKTKDYAQVRYEFAHKILSHFAEKNISMAFPSRTLYQAQSVNKQQQKSY